MVEFLDEYPQKSGKREDRRVKKKRILGKKGTEEKEYSQDKNTISSNENVENSHKEWDFIMDELKKRRDEEIKTTISQNLGAKEIAREMRFIELGHKKEVLDARRKYDMERVLNADLNEDDRHAQIELIEAEYIKKYADLKEESESPLDLENNAVEIHSVKLAAEKEDVVTEDEDEFSSGEGDSLNDELAKGLKEFYTEHDDLIKNADLDNSGYLEEFSSQVKSDREIKNFAKKMREELEESFNDVRIKFNKFNKKYSSSEEKNDKYFIGKLEKTINGYANRIKEFDNFDSYSRETLIRINQLHHEIQKWLDKDWIELYENRVKKIDSEKSHPEEESKDSLSDAIGNNEDGISVTGTEGALLELEHGDLHGTDMEMARDEKHKNESIIQDNTLSETERIELASLIEEKLAEIDSDYGLVMEKFHDFRESNKEEGFFHKIILKRILDVDEKRSRLRKKVKQEVVLNQEVLNNLIDLGEETIALFKENWSDELKKNKEKSELELTEEERVIVEKAKEVANKFIDGAGSGFNWDDFPKGRKDLMLETQTVAFLMREFKKRNLFKNIEEDVAEYIIKNRNN